MVETYQLSKIEHVVDIGKTLSKSWFRGQPKIYGELIPKMFRPEYLGLKKIKPSTENNLIREFQRNAPAILSEIPSSDESIEWLFLMQQHGAPTRLLDWTQSSLIALYFAVNKHHDEDGELWAMYPDALNKTATGVLGIPTIYNPKLKYLVLNSIYPTSVLKKNMGFVQEYPMALMPPLKFQRLITQLSTFTIHPLPNERNKITQILSKPNHLVRYIIPSLEKPGLLMHLACLGIKRHTLFPDLDSLSADLVDDIKIIAYSPPDPPVCDGFLETLVDDSSG